MNKFNSILLGLLIHISLYSAENNYRIGFFWAWNNPLQQPTDLLWQQMDSLCCNYAHFGRYNNGVALKQILNAAAERGLTAQAQWKPVYDTHYYSTRMVYFAGKWNAKRYFFEQKNPNSRTTGIEIFDPKVLDNLVDEIDVQKRTVIQAIPNQHPEGFITQHLIDDPYPENWIYQVRLDDRYHLKARLRINVTNDLTSSTPIVRVACIERSSRKVVGEKIITLQDFPELDSGEYEELYLLSFQRPYIYKHRTTGRYVSDPANPKDFQRLPLTLDFITYWYGQVETWFDYIKLDSDRAHKLFKGELDADLIEGIKDFKDHPALEHLLLKDEPEYAYFRPGNYLDKLLKANSHVRGMSVNNKEMFDDDYVLLEGLPQYVVDAYPIRGYLIPVPPSYAMERRGVIDEQMVPAYTDEIAYNDSLQKAFNEYFFNEMEPARAASLENNIPMWYCPQSFSSKIKGEKRLKYRCPTPEELEATVYLALTYGAKGLFYFRYTNTSESNFYIGGVVNDQLKHTEKTATTKWGETYYIGNDVLWEALVRLNPLAEKILKVTQDLTSVEVFNEDDLKSPFTNIDNWNRENHGDIHFGIFKDMRDDIYFMVVNKQCHPYAGQQFTLELTMTPNRDYLVWDLLQESNYQIRTNSRGKAKFNVSIGPGKGLLFKIYHTE